MSNDSNILVDELLEDVRLMVARARKHEAEFEDVFAAKDGLPTWCSIEESTVADGNFKYSLVVNCYELKGLKPIAADLCNNLVHALDQMIGALTRANGYDNSNRLYFPWHLDELEFEKSLRHVEKFIGRAAGNCIRQARETCRLALPVAHLAKEVSNTGKHWELMPSVASVPAVAINRPGSPQQIFNLPADTAEEKLCYDFYTGPERLLRYPMSVVLGLKFVGLGDNSISPTAVFGSAFFYVETLTQCISQSGEIAEMVEHFYCAA